MARAKQSSPLPLKYELSDVTTIKAECERLMSSVDARGGSFLHSGVAQVRRNRDKPTVFEVAFERVITGQPTKAKAAEDKVAFVAKCKVGGTVTLEAELPEVPNEVLREIATPLFYLAGERCRALVVDMGFPAPPVGGMPSFQFERGADKKSTAEPKAAVRVRPSRPAKRPKKS